MSNINKLLIIGDQHFKAEMGYADYLRDGRRSEKKSVISYILDMSKQCQGVVLLGDNLNNRNNPSEVIREFVEFVEGFGDKEIFILLGNHEKNGNGKSALDFMKEINKPNWHIVTNKIEKIDNLVFLPYFYKSEAGVSNNEQLKSYIMNNLPEGDYLFAHHAISGSGDGDFFNEVSLPYSELKSRFKRCINGHIHNPLQFETFTQAGSVFTDQVGEVEKFVYTLDIVNDTITPHLLPNRGIYKLIDPAIEDIKKLPTDSIAKIYINPLRPDYNEIKELAKSMNINFHIIEKVDKVRGKVSDNADIIDLNINDLLKLYADKNKLSIDLLLEGFDIIK